MVKEEKSLIEYSIFDKKYKKILITGGLGFIGSALIFRLLNKTNSKIFNIDKSIQKNDALSVNYQFSSFGESRYQLFNNDIKDKKYLKKILDQSDPDLVFHLAAESLVDRSIQSPINFLESNIIGTFNLLQAAKEYWSKLKPSRKNNFR